MKSMSESRSRTSWLARYVCSRSRMKLAFLPGASPKAADGLGQGPVFEFFIEITAEGDQLVLRDLIIELYKLVQHRPGVRHENDQH